MELIPSNGPHLIEESATINDEKCDVPFCPLCRIDSPVNQLLLRGLCPETIFNTRYIARLTEEGRLRYMGLSTSFIHYNTEESIWVLYDRKETEGRAVSVSSQTSLLLGLHTFDFSEVKDDKCTIGSKDKQVIVKLTSCGQGSFTCSDGECVSMQVFRPFLLLHIL